MTKSPFTDILTLIPDLILDLRYTTSNNICGKKISALKVALLNNQAANALKKAAEDFRKLNLKIVVWDAGRLQQTQDELRKINHENKYVAVHSKHLTGLAIDMTLADKVGNKLNMGTDFDTFTALSDIHHTQRKSVQENRSLLKNIMESHGFRQSNSEWWHFKFVTDEINLSEQKVEDYVTV